MMRTFSIYVSFRLILFGWGINEFALFLWWEQETNRIFQHSCLCSVNFVCTCLLDRFVGIRSFWTMMRLKKASGNLTSTRRNLALFNLNVQLLAWQRFFRLIFAMVEFINFGEKCINLFDMLVFQIFRGLGLEYDMSGLT